MREGPPEFKALSSMLTNWREEILNYFDHRLTNGFLEGKNNRIKTMTRVTYGYRNMENLRLRMPMSNHSCGTPLPHYLTKTQDTSPVDI